MGDTYRVVGGHRRREDGNVKTFDDGDLIEPTDAELAAFPDKFERVDDVDGDWVPERQSLDELGAPTAGEYELVATTHRRRKDGDVVVYEQGDVVELSEQEAQAFGDKFQRVPTDADEASSDGSDEKDAESSEQDTGDGDEQDAPGGDADDSSDDGDDADGESAPEGEASAITVPDDIDADDLPDDFPATLPDDYRVLQSLASENDIDGRQAKAELVDELGRRLRDGDA